MKKRYRTIVVTVMVMILLINPALLAWGNPPPGRWEKVTETKPGEKLIIYTEDGIQRRHRFISLNDEFLTCKNDNDEQFQFELAKVDKIVLPKSDKYMKDWAVWGAVAGAGLGILYSLSFGSSLGGQVAGAGIGAGAGAIGGGITGAVLGSPGETIYISKELAMKGAEK